MIERVQCVLFHQLMLTQLCVCVSSVCVLVELEQIRSLHYERLICCVFEPTKPATIERNLFAPAYTNTQLVDVISARTIARQVCLVYFLHR